MPTDMFNRFHHRTPAVIGSLKRSLLVAVLALFSTHALAENCSKVNAYWHTNMKSLVQNINECDKFAWQKCSQAAAIHYDLIAGSLGQRAERCGMATPNVPGWDYTAPQATDNRSCLTARENLREVFETRALARLACAAAREGGDDQDWLNSQCSLHRSRMGNYHLPFRTLVQSCDVDHRQLVATLTN